MARILDASGQATKKWQDVFATMADVGKDPQFIPFKAKGADALQHVESVLEEAVGSDPSLLGTLKAVGGALLTSFGRPVATLTDLSRYRLPKINLMQEAFLIDHEETLRGLSYELGRAKLLMRQLGNLLEQTRFDNSRVDQIMSDKSAVGDRTYLRIVDRLKHAKHPEEREKLQAQKDDMDKWMQDRDARVQAERPEVKNLRDRLEKLNDHAMKQADAMREAANSEGPSNVTGSRAPGAPSEVLETTHTRPDAVVHVASLQDFLIGSRVGLNRALAGEK